jgi:hypothetical protein
MMLEEYARIMVIEKYLGAIFGLVIVSVMLMAFLWDVGKIIVDDIKDRVRKLLGK